MKGIRWAATAVVVCAMSFLVLSSSSSPVSAQTTLVVDDDGQGSATDCDATDVAYSTIQAAVTAAASDDTILVCPGTYTETGQIVISKNLSLVGAGAGSTIIKPAGDTGSSGDARGWFLVNSGITFDLSDVTLDGTGRKVWQAIRHKGQGSISDCAFTNIKFEESGPSYAGTGIAAFGTPAMNVNVTNCAFTGIGRVGVLYFGSGITSSTFSGNTYTGKGAGDWLDYGVEVGGGAHATITRNTISANTGVASVDGSTSAGIVVTTYFGAGTTATITENFISGSTTGIAVGHDASDTSVATVFNNSLTGNTKGVESTAPLVDASANWWGSNTAAGVAAQVSANVDYTPWLDSGTDTDPGTAGFQGDFSVLNVDDDSPQTGPTGRIQEAIDLVSGSTVNVAAGTYDGFKIDSKTDLTVIGTGDPVVSGAKVSVPIACGSDLFKALVAVQDSSGVTIDGLTVDASGYFENCFFGMIYYRSSGTIQNSTIENIEGGGPRGGIRAQAGSSLAILDNTISEYDKAGIVSRSMDSIDIERNVITTTYHGTAPNGIDIGTYHGTNATIKDNEISGADYDQFDAGEYEVEWSGAAVVVIEAGDSLEVSGNTISNSDVGLDIESDSATISGNDLSDNLYGIVLWNANPVINFNSIAGNTSYGVYRTTQVAQTGTADATGNWWGSDTGPTHGLNPGGTGDAVSDNVAYSPWLGIGTDASGDPGFQPVSPMTWIVGPDVCLAVGCIQQAVDLASDGDTLDVKAGTYNEQVVIDKSLVVDGAGQGVTVVAPSPVTANTTRPGGGSVASAAGTPVRRAGPLVAALAVTADAASAGIASAASAGAGIIVVDGATDVTIQDLTVDGADNGITSCSTALFGVYWRNASGTIEGSQVRNIEYGAGLEGCQDAVGILAESGDGGSTTVTIDGNYVHDVQKNAIVARGSATTATISDNTVVGWGPTDKIAQNGIQVSFGAGGSITGNEASLYDYTPSTWAATGILVHYAADGVTVSGNQVHDNMEGIFVVNYFAPTMKNVEMSGNTVTDTRDTGVFLLLADDATVSGTTISGGAYGLWIADSNGASVHDSTIEDNDHGIIIDGSSTNASIYVNDILSNSGSSASGIHVECYGACPSGIEVHFNNIVGNSPVPGAYGIYNDTTNVVDATYNWWGACDGPSGVGPGSGDAVSDYVDYEPWVHGACDYDGDKLSDDQERLVIGTDWQNPDTDGDGCDDGLEYIAMDGFDPRAEFWYDFYDVPVPATPDPTSNGPRDQAVTMSDVLAVLFYVGTYDGGPANANGVAYDSVKGSCDWNADTAPDKEGLCYDRSPSPLPNPPWDSGPPSGAVSMGDVLAVLAQVGLSCAGGP